MASAAALIAHGAIGATALGTMGPGHRQVERGQEAVDIGNLAAGNDGKGVVEILRGAIELLGQFGGHFHRVRRFGDLN